MGKRVVGNESGKRGKRVGRGEREWEEGKQSRKRGKRVGRGEREWWGKRVGRGERKMRSKKIEEEFCIGQIIFVLPIVRGRWF